MLFTNIVHRLDVAASSRESLDFQWSEARGMGLATTTLITYPALFDADAMADVERLRNDGDELGLHFHNIKCARLLEKYNVREPVLWLWPREQRLALIDEMVATFTERFGAPPASIGGYIIDAWTLAQIRERHPTIRTAITSCFEEGVKMFYGNNRNWLLFSDGGPWQPHFPSRANALVPAANAEESIDIVALPHLNRDMIMALSSRDDWFASHPGNVFRARINQGPECPYLFRFMEAWERQAGLNGMSYLNVFVSSPWMNGDHWCVESEEDVRALYTTTLEYLKSREEAGAARVVTMSEYGEIFRKKAHHGDATICHWKDEIKESKREVVWTINPHHRCAWDMGRGGALIDFRPYAGRLDGNLGPESPLLWNGNYPFLVSAEHCGGAWNTSQNAEISDGQQTVNLADRRTRAVIDQTGQSAWTIRSGPVRYELNGHALVIESEWDVSGDSTITIRRRILEFGGDVSQLCISELFFGRAGSTEYPDDQRGILLRSSDGELAYQYSGEEMRVPGVDWVGADIPRLGIHLRMSALVSADFGCLTDGTVFSPSFRLRLTYAAQPLTGIVTCLSTTPLKNP